VGSPQIFEVVLLDHGQYFDIEDQLRVDYSRLWLSLIAPLTPEVQEERRKYAALVGNIGPELVLSLNVLPISPLSPDILHSTQCLKPLSQAGQHLKALGSKSLKDRTPHLNVLLV
jgi:hypothetical protein